ncbi:hypothetical protein [Qipengyuania nanhaisediminis]|uniref:hypothetical protein n=1 Tax=Qipengyuania nanhaisediminis TaxID=604088 RepID=UPI0038B32505
MYSFFALSGTPGARAAAIAGSIIITLILMAPATVEAMGPSSHPAIFTAGVLA